MDIKVDVVISEARVVGCKGHGEEDLVVRFSGGDTQHGGPGLHQTSP